MSRIVESLYGKYSLREQHYNVTQLTVGDYIEGDDSLIDASSIPIEVYDENKELIFSAVDVPSKHYTARRRNNSDPNKYPFEEILNMTLLYPPRVSKWSILFMVQTSK